MKKIKLILLATIMLVITACTNDNKDLDTTKVYYEFGTPTTSSVIDYHEVINSSTSNVLAKLEGQQLSICIYSNNKLECFKNNNYDLESEHLKNVFSEDDCYESNSSIWCLGIIDGNAFQCLARPNGDVGCSDILCEDESYEKCKTGLGCELSFDGNVKCD